MSPEQKFRFHEPSKTLLSEIGELVDELEDLITTGQAYEGKLDSLNERLCRPVTAHDICSYYGASTRDEFVRGALVPLPHSFTDLHDEELLWLTARAISLCDDLPQFTFYAQIVEHAIPPSDTTVFELVMDEELTDPAEVLSELRRRKRRVFQM